MLATAIAAGASVAGIWWASARDDGLDAAVQVVAEVSTRDDGDRGVLEELTFDPDELGEHELVRRIDPPAGGRVVLLDGASEHVLVEPRADDGLTVVVEPEAGPSIQLAYVLLDDGDESVDLGRLNAPADIHVTSPDLSVELRTSLGAHEAIRFPEEDRDNPPWSTVGLVVGLLAVAAWLVVLRSRPRTEALADEVDEPPSAHSPAVVGWLLRHGRVTVEDLAATVVDLTARGFILPFRQEGELVLGQGRPAVDVAPHEQLVLEWLFGDWVRRAELGAQREAIRSDPSRWSNLWTGFVEAVEAQGRSEDLVERDVASPSVLTAAAAGLGLLVAGMVGTAHGHPGWLAAIVAGALVLSSATAFARRTAEGEALAAHWEAFGARLRSGTDLTPHALAYTVTLGEEPASAPPGGVTLPAQLVHDEVERHIVGWREAYLSATSVRGEPSERVRALLSLRALRRRAPGLIAGLRS